MNVKIRVLLTRRFMPEDMDYIRSRIAPNVELIVPDDLGPAALAEAVQNGAEVLLGEPPGKEVLDKAKDLRLIQVPWTGVDRLDFALLRQYPFTVCNSHSSAGVVAEYACALLLSAAKWIPYHDRQLRRGKWCRPNQGDSGLFRPPESLRGKTAGIVGYGAVGRALAGMLDGFGMFLRAVDARPEDETPRPLSRLGGPERLLEMIAAADYLVVAAPLTPDTRGMIGAEAFDRMKSSAYLINVSRGELIVEEALYRALEERRIAGAAIDTWYQYPTAKQPDVFPSGRFPFHELDNLILSPHRAGFARGELPHLDDAIENINRFASGRELINVVDTAKGF